MFIWIAYRVQSFLHKPCTTSQKTFFNNIEILPTMSNNILDNRIKTNLLRLIELNKLKTMHVPETKPQGIANIYDLKQIHSNY